MEPTTFLMILALAAGFYMAWNIGANDVANTMGTVVGAGSLTLKRAVIIAAICEFIGAYYFGSRVSQTIKAGIIHTEIFTHEPYVLAVGMVACLMATGIWLQIASYFGWPVSTTHSIVGAIAGFALVIGGWSALQTGKLMAIVGSWLFSPILGGALSYFMFGFLRRSIFNNKDPLIAAKKITPWVVFFFFFLLTLLALFTNIEPYKKKTLGVEILLIGGLIGTWARAICLHYLRYEMVKGKDGSSYLTPDDPEMILGVEKAIKHLKRIQRKSTGTIQQQVQLKIDELKLLLKQFHFRESPSDHAIQVSQVEKVFSYLQIISASFMALSHGANDVSNAVGPLAAVISILKSGEIAFSAVIPPWLLLLGGSGIVLGLATWGWRVIETVGKKITELTPSRGFSAELACATTVMLSSQIGLPVSTTHTLVGSILGVGVARGLGAINLSTIKEIVLSWVVTIPIGAGFAIFIYRILKAIV